MASQLLHVVMESGDRGPTSREPPSSRLELVLDDTTQPPAWVLYLRVEPTQWYLNSLDQGTRIDTARRWIDSVKNRPLPPKPREAQNLIVSVAEYCPHSARCTFATGNNGCNKRHSDFTCAWPCPKKTGEEAPCSWFLFEELRLPLTDDYFVLMARENKEFSRDLLFLPMPIHMKHVKQPITQDAWHGHYTNAELARMPFFWTKIFEKVACLRELTKDPSAVEVIALNFGEWESQRASDPYALECHGHAHLHLSENAQIKLSQMTGWEALSGRHYAPPHYAWDDACRLESHYVLTDELKRTNEKIAQIASAQTKLEEKQELTNQLLSQLLDHVKSSDSKDKQQA